MLIDVLIQSGSILRVFLMPVRPQPPQIDHRQDDQHRLQVSIMSSFGQPRFEQEWIEKYRAAVVHRRPERRRLVSMPVAALTLGMISLGSAMYLFSIFNVHSLHLK
jgi:hypothetical protein